MKVSQIKSKVAAKVAKGKAKVAKKCGKAKRGAVAASVLALVGLCAGLGGCQNPAQRAQTAEVKIIVEQGGTANFGSEFVSLAQSNETGGNDAGQTASPTTETKPEIAVGVGGSSAGVGGTSGASKQGVGAAIGGAADAVSGLFTTASDAAAPAAPAAQSAAPSAAAPAASSSVPTAQADGASCPDGACPASGEADCPACRL